MADPVFDGASLAQFEAWNTYSLACFKQTGWSAWQAARENTISFDEVWKAIGGDPALIPVTKQAIIDALKAALPKEETHDR